MLLAASGFGRFDSSQPPFTAPASFAHQFLVSERISPANQTAHGRLGGRAPLRASRLRSGWPVPGAGAGGLSEHASQLRARWAAALRAVNRASPPAAFHGALDCGQPRLCASLPPSRPHCLLFCSLQCVSGGVTLLRLLESRALPVLRTCHPAHRASLDVPLRLSPPVSPHLPRLEGVSPQGQDSNAATALS